MDYQYLIYLAPYLSLRKEHEALRAARARVRTKVKSIPRRFVSVNNMYPINRGGRGKRLSDEGRIFKQYVFDEMLRQDLERGEMSPSFHFYSCAYVFLHTEDMMFTKGGKVKRTDVSNYLKAAEDAVFEYLDDDDSLVLDIAGFKRMVDCDPRLLINIWSSDPQAGISFCGRDLSL